MKPRHRLPHLTSLAVLVAAAAVSGCGGGGSSAASEPPAADVEPYVYSLPYGFPQPKTDPTRPFTVAQVALGRYLFYDERMAYNEQGSCVSCHEQRLAFSDGRNTSISPSGELHPRNAMSLTNPVYNARQNWANPNLQTLREQALVVLLNENPVELGWSGHEDEILARFRDDAAMAARYQAAFPDASNPFTLDHTLQALAAFTSTLISGNSAYDRQHRAVNPEPAAMSEAALRGEQLFFSETFECHHCHNGFNMANSVVYEGAVLDQIEYRNTALYNIAGPGVGYPLERGNYPYANQGLYEFTQLATDMGRFRPPTLRNVALTAPYMHDGSIGSLREVIVEHYAPGGRLISTGDYAGNGADNPYKDSLMIGFSPTEQQVSDLLAFLDSLTDWDFICAEAFSDPYGRIPLHSACPAP